MAAGKRGAVRHRTSSRVRCRGAIVLARLPLVVYGTTDPKAGACHTLYEITSDPRLNHRAQVVAGALADQLCRRPQRVLRGQAARLGKG